MTSPALDAEPRTPPARKKKRNGGRELLAAIPWIGPGLVLIFAIVLFPAGYMVYNSTRDISRSGVDRGSAGAANYEYVLSLSDLPGVLLRTVIWVVTVVVGTILVSLVLAHFLNKAFPGRQLVRLAVIIPWAASVVMTTTVLYYGLQPKYGIIQQFLFDIGLQDRTDFGFTRSMPSAFIVAILIAIFVSLPFTTYTLLAGTQGIGADILEAARVDGAGGVRTYFSIVLPQLRPALAVATIINIINVFNSFPILKVITGDLPGYQADTTTTMMFKLLQVKFKVGEASALSVLNFAIVILVIVAYMWIVKPMKGVDE